IVEAALSALRTITAWRTILEFTFAAWSAIVKATLTALWTISVRRTILEFAFAVEGTLARIAALEFLGPFARAISFAWLTVAAIRSRRPLAPVEAFTPLRTVECALS